MPVIITFLLLLPVAYYLAVTGKSSVASLLPWSQALRSIIAGNMLVANSIATAVSCIGLIASGASVLFVRGKTLVVGSKKTLIVFSALFLVCSIVLIMRLFHLAEPYLVAFAHRKH